MMEDIEHPSEEFDADFAYFSEAMYPIVMRKSKFAPKLPVNNENRDGTDAINDFYNSRILAVGAGGIGCEALKNLVMSGFRNIDVTDLDTIDVSNLNRQFMFGPADVGAYKSHVAGQFIKKYHPDVKDISTSTAKIQARRRRTISNFKVVVACLDNNEARHYINDMLIDAVAYTDAPEKSAMKHLNVSEVLRLRGDPIQPGQTNHLNTDVDNNVSISYYTPSTPDPSTQVLLLDSGTEGLKGHVAVVIPGAQSACLYCSETPSAASTSASVPMCTLANVPRTPEHCIVYAQVHLWPRLLSFTSYNQYQLNGRPPRFPSTTGGMGVDDSDGESGVDEVEDGENDQLEHLGPEVPDAITFDSDNEDHMTWLWRRACERAAFFNIALPTYGETMKVVKNIIPAIGATNAVVSAMCCAQIVQLILNNCISDLPRLNYLSDFYTTGTNILVNTYDKSETCKHCKPRVRFVIPRQVTVKQAVATFCFVSVFDYAYIINKHKDTDSVVFNHITHQHKLELLASEVFDQGDVFEMQNGGANFKFEVVYE